MRWISVTEAIPHKLNREYLVWCKNNKCVYAAYLIDVSEEKYEWRCFCSGDELPEKVTHWMPCPIGPDE